MTEIVILVTAKKGNNKYIDTQPVIYGDSHFLSKFSDGLYIRDWALHCN